MPKRKKSDKKKSPIAVSVIAVAIVVLFLIRLYQVYEPLIRQNFFKNGITGPLFNGLRLTPLGNDLLSSLTYLVLSLAGIFVLIGFLRLQRWSWVLLMAWTGASLAISLVDYFYSHANYAVMASNVIIAFALNIPDVQRIFGIRRDNDGSSH
jgi:low affinity Fe/Cu permease